MELLGACFYAYRWGWSCWYKSHLVWHLSSFPNYIWVLWKSSCPGDISFLPPPPSHPCITTIPPPLLVICLLWEDWAWEWKQNINWNSFWKHKQGCWKKQLPFYTAPSADHNHSLNQWTRAWTNFQTGTNLSLPVIENSCSFDSQIHSIETVNWWLVKQDQYLELYYFHSPMIIYLLTCKLKTHRSRRNPERPASLSLKAYQSRNNVLCL